MNVGKMMKNLQEMQAKMQQQIETVEVEATSGGGIVTARMNGKKELTALTLTPDAITPEEPDLMADLIIAAVNEAGRKVDEEMAEVTQGLAGGLNIPGLT